MYCASYFFLKCKKHNKQYITLWTFLACFRPLETEILPMEQSLGCVQDNLPSGRAYFSYQGIKSTYQSSLYAYQVLLTHINMVMMFCIMSSAPLGFSHLHCYQEVQFQTEFCKVNSSLQVTAIIELLNDDYTPFFLSSLTPPDYFLLPC